MFDLVDVCRSFCKFLQFKMLLIAFFLLGKFKFDEGDDFFFQSQDRRRQVF